MIFTAISTIAGVRGTRVYIPRRLTNRSIDSSKSISASPQDNTPLAAWFTWMLMIDMHGLEKVTNIKQDSETSLYCFHRWEGCLREKEGQRYERVISA